MSKFSRFSLCSAAMTYLFAVACAGAESGRSGAMGGYGSESNGSSAAGGAKPSSGTAPAMAMSPGRGGTGAGGSAALSGSGGATAIAPDAGPSKDPSESNGGAARDANVPEPDAADSDARKATADAAVPPSEVDPKANPLTGGWKSRDIGPVKTPGKASLKDGVFTITNAGKDHWHEEDYFHYVYMPLAGDGEIIARVTMVQKVNGNSAAGVMFRNDLNFTRELPGKVTAPGVQFFTTGSQVMWGERWVSMNQNSGWQPGGNVGTVSDPAKLPVWFKVQRKGDRFYGWYSVDGTVWKSASNDNPNYLRESAKPIRAIESAPTMWVGIFYCSHDSDKAGSATIDSVKVTPGTPITPMP